MKRKYIIILIFGILSIAIFSTFFLYKNGFFFNPRDRYNSSHLNYMGVIFENESDIQAFNEGYSESSDCPWEFEHNGIDFFFKNNSNVIAAAPGQVWRIEKRENSGNNAYTVRIWIRFNRTTLLGYNFEPWTTKESDRNNQISMFKVSVGDWVQKGDIIAKFLECNISAHIHFDITESDKRFCPRKYFSLEGYLQMMNLIHTYNSTWELCYP